MLVGNWHSGGGLAFEPTDTTLIADEYSLAGVPAAQAAAAMKLPAGFRVDVCASEPDVMQPIAMALDHRGRVWIAEAFEYPRRADGEAGQDRILIFEDTDGDNHFDRRTVFAEGLNLVSGLEVGFGGVWVGAAPYLLFIPDADADDRPDGPPVKLLDGWGFQDTHETLNAFIWGPDGWLYGCQGVFTHSLVGKPGTDDTQRIPMNAGVWRYHPTQHRFEVFAHGTSNPWGVDFNDYGDAFVTACVIPHLFHIIPGARYQRQAGPHFNAYTYQDITTIADHRHFVGAQPHAGNGKSNDAGGGHAHAGAMIYLGDTWPSEYRNTIFMNNIHGQRLNCDILRELGSGYVGSHGDDFLLTDDQASQILNLRYGPDGNAYMIDWYDMQACHERDSTKHDRSNGRIYKISYGSSSVNKNSSQPQPNLSSASDLELAALMLHRNDWFVRHARRMLQERAVTGTISQEAIERLYDIATKHEDTTRQLRGMWALSVLGEFDTELFNSLRVDSDPHVRGWATRLVTQAAATNSIAAVADASLVGMRELGQPLVSLPPEAVQAMAALAHIDPSPIVRLSLASLAARLPLQQRNAIVQHLLAHDEDVNDHNLPLMIWYAAEPLVASNPSLGIELAAIARQGIASVAPLIYRRIAALKTPVALAVLLQAAAGTDDIELQRIILSAVQTGLAGQRAAQPPENWSSMAAKLLHSSDASVRQRILALGVLFGDTSAIEQLAEQASDTSLAPQARREALDAVLVAKPAGLDETLLKLCSDADVGAAAIAALASYNNPRTARVLLDVYTGLSPEHQRLAIATMTSRPSYAVALLNAIEANQIPLQDLTADSVNQLHNLQDAQVDPLLTRVWGSIRDTPAERLKLIGEYNELVKSKDYAKPDVHLGRDVFSKTCMQCHELFGLGGKIGPGLTGSNRANLDYILANIVDPSAVVAKEYRASILLLKDDRVVTGIVLSEDQTALNLQTATTLETIPLDEIEERKLSDQSMMPEDQLRTFSPHEIRSLIEYLASPRQVAEH